MCYVVVYPTPGRVVGINDSLDAMPTPETPYGSTWEPNPSARTRKAFKRVLDNMPENNYDRLAKRRKKMDERITTQNQMMSDNIRKALGFNPDELEDDNDDKHGILSGVIAYVPKRMDRVQKQVYSKIGRLGGDYRWLYNSDITHIIIQGNPKEVTKELKLMKDHNSKIVVNPEWVTACEEQNAWVSESLYSPSHNPNMSLTVVREKVLSPKSTQPCLVVSPCLQDRQHSSQRRAATLSVQATDADETPVLVPDLCPYLLEETEDNTEVVRELEELEQLAAADSADTQTQNYNNDPSAESIRGETIPLYCGLSVASKKIVIILSKGY